MRVCTFGAELGTNLSSCIADSERSIEVTPVDSNVVACVGAEAELNRDNAANGNETQRSVNTLGVL